MEAATTLGAPAPLAAAPPQHMVALRRANEIRLGHAHLKRDVLAGRVTVIAALTDPRASGSILVVDLLKAQRGWGTTRARRLLGKLQISEAKRVDALTGRQRQMLVAALPRA